MMEREPTLVNQVQSVCMPKECLRNGLSDKQAFDQSFKSLMHRDFFLALCTVEELIKKVL